jgi:antitoxin component YwqK of YwqJK toxin-antitoxin module
MSKNFENFCKDSDNVQIVLGSHRQKFFNENGDKNKDLVYETGFFKYANGNYEEVDSNGIFKSYYEESEKIEYILNLFNGNLDGEYIRYYENGQICFLMNLNNNIRKNLIGYYENGELRITKEYLENGENITKEYLPSFLQK